MDNINTDADKLTDLKHHIYKMRMFSNYFRRVEIADKYLKALDILEKDLFEAVDVDD